MSRKPQKKSTKKPRAHSQPPQPSRVLGTDYELSRPDMMLEFKQHTALSYEQQDQALSVHHNKMPLDNWVECGDVIQALIHKKCVWNLIFADMPFNIGKAYAVSDNLSYSNYMERMHKYLKLAYDKLSLTGTFVILNNQRNMPVVIDKAIKLGFWLQNIIIWPLRASVPSDERLERTWQPIMVFTKECTGFVFEPFADLMPHSKEHDKLFGRKEKFLYADHSNKTQQWRRQHDIWHDIAKVNKKHPEAILNKDGALKYSSTQMPLALAMRIIKTYTRSGHSDSLTCPWILDMFAGSGAFCAAADILGRKWTAVEVNKQHAADIPKNIKFLKKVWKQEKGEQ